MFRLMLSDCQQPLDAQMRGDDFQLTGFSIDTRTLEPGDLFVAIKGDRFDGHDYCAEAQRLGAAGLVVSRPVDSSLPMLEVEDTRLALAQLARVWADGYQVPTVAITGSNGKTTVKEMISAILQQLGPVLATSGNLNNDIGVPLTLLRLRQQHRYAVIEMGANHIGEIEYLSKLVRPDVAVLNNVGAAHLEGFGSIENVAAAKSELFAGVLDDGWAVFNTDDRFAGVMAKAAAHCHVRRFGSSADADVRLLPETELRIQTSGKTLAPRFALLGKHNRMNAVAATAAAECLDIQPVAIMAGLAATAAVAGRLEQKPGYNGARLIDDTYNANPVSVSAAIDVLREFAGKRILVLGDMAELGSDEAELHADMGRYAKQAGIEQLYTVGRLSAEASKAFGDAAVHSDTKDELVAALRKQLDSNSTVLVKGSRGSAMESVVEQLPDNRDRSESSEALEADSSTEAISL